MKQVIKISVWLGVAALIVGYTSNTAHGQTQVWEEWATTYNGTSNYHDQARALAVDQNGNVIVTGESWVGPISPNGSYNYLTCKYDANGILQWSVDYDGTGGDNDFSLAVCVDADGYVYITGESPGLGSSEDYLTIKYHPNGAPLWEARYNGIGNDTDKAYDIAVDNVGNVYVTGQSDVGTGYRDYATIKYDPDGVRQWIATYNGPGDYWDEGLALEIDAAGNVYVTGYSDGNASGFDFTTIKYDSSGNELWVARFEDGEIARDLAIDNEGNVYVTGVSYGAPYFLYIVKYNSNGEEQWVVVYDGSTSWDDPEAIAVDQDGNVYVTGWTEPDGEITEKNYLTVKYNTDGIFQWEAIYNGPGNDDDIPADLVLDEEANVYVTGTSINSGSNDDFATIKYDSDGNLQWIARYAGQSGGIDAGHAIGVDAEGNVYVAGSTWIGGNYTDLAVVGYSQSSDELTVSLTPSGIPIQIPASGGTFSYQITVANNSSIQYSLDVWCAATLPGGIQSGTVLGPFGLEFSAGSSLSRDRDQTVPAIAPAGEYSYNAYIGSYPDMIWYQDSFNFEKLQTGFGDEFSAWTCKGENFVSEVISNDNVTFTAAGCLSHRNSPNPFNVVTVIGFELPVGGWVKLEVFDIHGRQVSPSGSGTTPTTEYFSPGYHEVTFDGSGLASGIYIYRLEAEEFIGTDKMVLLK